VNGLDVTSQVGLCLEADGDGWLGGSADVAREWHVAWVFATVCDEIRRLTERSMTQTTDVRLLTFCTVHTAWSKM